jgi:DNA-binding PadR family transcriptional regulator
MEDRGWVKGRWVEKEGRRRRCYYTLTPEGAEVLARQRQEWGAFSAMVNQLIGVNHA